MIRRYAVEDLGKLETQHKEKIVLSDTIGFDLEFVGTKLATSYL